MANTQSNIFPFLAELLRSGFYSDFSLQCEGQAFRLHKAVVCSQSPVLASAFQGPFQEETTKTVEVDNSFDADTVQRMVDYLYTESYSINAPKVEPRPTQEASADQIKDDFLRHLRIYSIAAHYEIPGLETLATANIKSLLEEKWPAEILPDIAIEALEKTGEGPLFDLMVKAVSNRLERLVYIDGFETLAQYPAFMVKVVRGFMVRLRKVGEVKAIASDTK